MPLANRNLNLERLYHNPKVLYGRWNTPSEMVRKKGVFLNENMREGKIAKYEGGNETCVGRLNATGN